MNRGPPVKHMWPKSSSLSLKNNPNALIEPCAHLHLPLFKLNYYPLILLILFCAETERVRAVHQNYFHSGL